MAFNYDRELPPDELVRLLFFFFFSSPAERVRIAHWLWREALQRSCNRRCPILFSAHVAVYKRSLSLAKSSRNLFLKRLEQVLEHSSPQTGTAPAANAGSKIVTTAISFPTSSSLAIIDEPDLEDMLMLSDQVADFASPTLGKLLRMACSRTTDQRTPR